MVWFFTLLRFLLVGGGVAFYGRYGGGGVLGECYAGMDLGPGRPATF